MAAGAVRDYGPQRNRAPGTADPPRLNPPAPGKNTTGWSPWPRTWACGARGCHRSSGVGGFLSFRRPLSTRRWCSTQRDSTAPSTGRWENRRPRSYSRATTTCGTPTESRPYRASARRGSPSPNPAAAPTPPAPYRPGPSRDGDDWIINGSKVFISGALWGDWGVVVRTYKPGDAPGGHGVRGGEFVVGLRPHADTRDSGPIHPAQLFFQDLRVPSRNVLGEVDGGWDLLANKLLARSRIPYSAANLGVSGGGASGWPWSILRRGRRSGRPSPPDRRYSGCWSTPRWKSVHAGGLSGKLHGNSTRVRTSDRRRRLPSCTRRMCWPESWTGPLQVHGGYGVTQEMPLGNAGIERRGCGASGRGAQEVNKMLIATGDTESGWGKALAQAGSPRRQHYPYSRHTRQGDDMSEQVYSPELEDVGNIVGLEHVNLTVPDQSTATAFYVGALGGTRDPYLMVGPGQYVGELGRPAVPPPDQRGSAPARPRRAGGTQPGTGSGSSYRGLRGGWGGRSFPGRTSTAASWVTGPWGNTFHCCDGGSDKFGEMSLGIPYVEFDVPAGTSDGIARFYQGDHGRAGGGVGRDGEGECRGRVRSCGFTESNGRYRGNMTAITSRYTWQGSRGRSTRWRNEA